MRKYLIRTAILLIFAVFTSCYSPRPISSERSDNNRTYRVDYLFEHDGCKVYRFYDKGGSGDWVYFTNCQGNVTSFKNDSTREQITNSVRITHESYSDMVK